MVNSIPATHKDRRMRKANTYIQKGNQFAQKANKATHTTMSVANVAKSKLDKAMVMWLHNLTFNINTQL